MFRDIDIEYVFLSFLFKNKFHFKIVHTQKYITKYFYILCVYITFILKY